jgi:putative oxidoreductase
MTNSARYQLRNVGQAALRIGAGILFFSHGAAKLFGWFGGMPPDHGTVHLMSQLGMAGVIETFGGILLVLGLFTRPAALIMSGEMAVAFVQIHTLGHHDARWWVNGGELALVFSLVWLFFACAGAGAWSLDFRRRRDIADPMPMPRFRAPVTTVYAAPNDHVVTSGGPAIERR